MSDEVTSKVDPIHERETYDVQIKVETPKQKVFYTMNNSGFCKGCQRKTQNYFDTHG